MSKTIGISLALALAISAPLHAQSKGTKAGSVPPGQRPPAGMCRIWLEGVPPGQQPAPTDCTTAVRNRPANGRVIFGNDYTDAKGRKPTNSGDRRTAPRDDRDDRTARANNGDRDDDNDANRADRKVRDRATSDDSAKASERRGSSEKKHKPKQKPRS